MRHARGHERRVRDHYGAGVRRGDRTGGDRPTTRATSPAAGGAATATLDEPWYEGLRWPFLAFLVAAAVAAVLFTLVPQVLGLADDLIPNSVRGYPGDAWLGGRARWDADHYANIAANGYSTTPDWAGFTAPAFFPAYPLAMRLVALVTGDVVLAGIVVNVAAGAAAACLLYRWVADRFGRATARASVVVLLVYPYTFYCFGVVYSEPLFLAAAIGAFVLLERDHVLAAGLAGAVASGTRLVGVAVAVALVLRLLERRGVLDEAATLWPGRRRPAAERRSWSSRLRCLRPGDAWILLAIGGLVGYMIHLAVAFGDPLLFQRSGVAWGQGEGLRTLFKVRTATFFVEGLPYMKLELVVQVALLLGAFVLAGAVARQVGRAYGWYVVLVLGIPLVTIGNLFGAGRYVLAAFPVVVVVATWFATRPDAARRVAAACVGFTAISVVLYARALWVS